MQPRRYRFGSPVALLLLLVACAPATLTSQPASAVSTLSTSVTPVVTATPSHAAQPVTFHSPDGAEVAGQQYGTGTVGVIFAPMGDCVGDWAALATDTASHGLVALTFQWRACQPGGVDSDQLRLFVDDLRGAIDYVRAQGAEHVILAGASLGGVASARLLAEVGAVGLVVVAAPADVPSLGVSVTAPDLASPAPKLFVTADADTVVAPSATRALHDLAADPKTWQTYPGSAHGTHLFATEFGSAAQQQILEFILAAASAPPTTNP